MFDVYIHSLVYILSQLIRFARASSQFNGFNIRNKFELLNFLSKGTVIINYVKHFLSFRSHSELMSKYYVRLKTLLQESLSEPKPAPVVFD